MTDRAPVSDRATIVNLPKLVIAATVVVLGFVLVLVGKLDAGAWLGVAGFPAGLVVGNGVTVRRGQTAEPIIGRKPE